MDRQDQPEEFAGMDTDDLLNLGFVFTEHLIMGRAIVMSFVGEHHTLTLLDDATLKVQKCCNEITFNDVNICLIDEMVSNVK